MSERRPLDKLPQELFIDVIHRATEGTDGRWKPWDRRSAAAFALPVVRLERYLARFPGRDWLNTTYLRPFLAPLLAQSGEADQDPRLIPTIRALIAVAKEKNDFGPGWAAGQVLEALVAAGATPALLVRLIREAPLKDIHLTYDTLSWKITSLDDPVQHELFELVYESTKPDDWYFAEWFLRSVFSSGCIQAGPQNWRHALALYAWLEPLFENDHDTVVHCCVAAVLSGSVELYRRITPPDLDPQDLVGRLISRPIGGDIPLPQQVGSAEMTSFLVSLELPEHCEVIEMWRDRRTLVAQCPMYATNFPWKAGFLRRALDASRHNFETIYLPFPDELSDIWPEFDTDFGYLNTQVDFDLEDFDDGQRTYLTGPEAPEDIRRLRLLGLDEQTIDAWKEIFCKQVEEKYGEEESDGEEESEHVEEGDGEEESDDEEEGSGDGGESDWSS